MSFSTTWTWSRQIFRRLLDVQPIECQRLVCTCWVSTSLAPNLGLFHFHNGNDFISRSSSPRLAPVSTKTASFQGTVLFESFIMYVAKKKKNTRIKVKTVSSVSSAVKHETRQARENSVPSAGKRDARVKRVKILCQARGNSAPSGGKH